MSPTCMRMSIAASVAMLIDAARVKQSNHEMENSNSVNMQNVSHPIDRVACPVISALFHSGDLQPDRHGRVERQQVFDGLLATGASFEAAQFQARIAAYEDDDLHQEVRYNGRPTDPPGPKYLNIFTMSKTDQCRRAQHPETDAGYPCNVNTQFIQHGFSTTMRAPDNGLSNKGFDRYMKMPGVMTSVGGFLWWGRTNVMTIEGLGKLLAHVRTENGDYSGDQSLNARGGLPGSNMAKYHPSVTSTSNYTPLSQWQALFAWGAFFVAFSKESSGVVGIPESDLRALLIEGRFPDRYEKKAWSLESGLKVVTQMAGSGAGEEMIQAAIALVDRLGSNGGEQNYIRGLMGTLLQMGLQDDDISNTYEDAISMLSTDA